MSKVMWTLTRLSTGICHICTDVKYLFMLISFWSQMDLEGSYPQPYFLPSPRYTVHHMKK